MEEKLLRILDGYEHCNYGKLCTECDASERIPFTKTSYCEFLRQHGKNVIETITDKMEKLL